MWLKFVIATVASVLVWPGTMSSEQLGVVPDTNIGGGLLLTCTDTPNDIAKLYRRRCCLDNRENARCNLRLNLMMVAAIGFGLFGVVQVQVANAGPSTSTCDLPKDLQSAVESKYPGRTLVSFSDLGDDAKELFQREHGDGCPGMVKLDFYGDDKPTFALALATKRVAKGKTELVLAQLLGVVWKTTTMATTGGPARVVWSEKPGEYKDVQGRKKIRSTNPVIIFCDYSSWEVLYAWTNNKVARLLISRWRSSS